MNSARVEITTVAPPIPTQRPIRVKSIGLAIPSIVWKFEHLRYDVLNRYIVSKSRSSVPEPTYGMDCDVGESTVLFYELEKLSKVTTGIFVRTLSVSKQF